MKKKEIAILLQYRKSKGQGAPEVLDVLEAEGKVFVSRKGKYTKGQAKRMEGIPANARGFGFLCFSEGVTEDVFIPEENTNEAFEGDG